MFVSWMVLFVAACGMPVWLLARDYRQARDTSVADRHDWDLVDTALLRGGRAGRVRAADAIVADLVDRGVLEVSDTHTLTPVSPAAGPFTGMEKVVVEYTGKRTARLWSIRNEITDNCDEEFDTRYRELRKIGVLLSLSGQGMAFAVVHTAMLFLTVPYFLYWIDGIFTSEPLWLWDGPAGRARLLMFLIFAVPVGLVVWRERLFRMTARSPLGDVVAERLATTATAADGLGRWVALHGLATANPDQDDPRPLILGTAAPA
ncbi:TIGR04222 domain-containing membrane protein [Actinokineospora terrae]|uniref:TIGR04222 domain-containing protein n=1 Tax=Actinokineospora terrae TaxID=155974 RepID=A0A1H9MXF1_9PSEU|nr:TIGR04222 domain-containing membrane protein [Actinokineospora terrae]SER28390.1 TIGR04222 domain-containing protein [Actinokineospora terrae]